MDFDFSSLFGGGSSPAVPGGDPWNTTVNTPGMFDKFNGKAALASAAGNFNKNMQPQPQQQQPQGLKQPGPQYPVSPAQAQAAIQGLAAGQSPFMPMSASPTPSAAPAVPSGAPASPPGLRPQKYPNPFMAA